MFHESISVLLVDENPIFVEILSRFLHDDCLNDVALVGTAATYAEAGTQAQNLRPEVILVDHGLPGQIGISCVAHLRALLPEVSIIVLTLRDKPEYRKSALAAGADDFLQKDDVFTELVPTIRRIVWYHGRKAI